MLQPRFKKMADGKSRKVFITDVKSSGYRFDPALARRLLLDAHLSHDVSVNHRKEQPCQHSRSQGLSTGTPLMSHLNGSGAVRLEAVSGPQAITPLKWIHTLVKPPKTNFPASSFSKRSSLVPLTRSIVAGLSVMSITRAGISRIISLDTNREFSWMVCGERSPAGPADKPEGAA